MTQHFWQITRVEAKLILREPTYLIVGLLLPTLVLVAIGLLFAPHKADPELGGARWIDLFVPSMVVMTLAVLGINALPIRFAQYRELGVLRRLSTTPASPAALLFAQLAIHVAMAVAGVVLLMVVGTVMFQIPLPQAPLGFLLAFVLGMGSLYALGLLIAAIAPTTAVANALVWPLFVAVMFLGGVYLPRVLLPEFLQRLGDFTPPGVQALLDAWAGTMPAVLPLVVMAAIAGVAGVVAARSFRWE